MQQTHAMDNKHYGTQRRIDGQQWCYKTDPAENSTGRPSLDPTKPTPPPNAFQRSLYSSEYRRGANF